MLFFSSVVVGHLLLFQPPHDRGALPAEGSGQPVVSGELSQNEEGVLKAQRQKQSRGRMKPGEEGVWRR